MSKISQLISTSNAEKPRSFPSLTDWVIYWFGDPTTDSIPLPMQMKVTSGLPKTGQVSGIAFFDPGTTMVDANGKPVDVPPLIPIPHAPYSSKGVKGTWMHIREFQDIIYAQVKAAGKASEDG